MPTADKIQHFLSNLRRPMPFQVKVWRTLRNLSRRLHGERCCGHPGQPGC